MKTEGEKFFARGQVPTPAGTVLRFLALVGLAAVALSACTGGPPPAPVASAVVEEAQVTPTTALSPTAGAVVEEAQVTAALPPAAGAVGAATPVKTGEALPPEVIVYASDLPGSALTDELAFWDDPSSPGGKMIGLPNTGDELDPPPENDPSVTFQVQVQRGVPYRCWMHMKVGAPKGKSQANKVWAQFSDTVDPEGREVYRPGTASYLTAQGPEQEGWTWVGCDPPDKSAPPLIYFATSGPTTVRLQAGMEGVGFDQFVLSPARFLDNAPSGAVVEQ